MVEQLLEIVPATNNIQGQKMKTFKPYNRYMLIEMIEEPEEQQTGVLLPEDFKPEQSECAVVKVLDYALSCDLLWIRGELAVVERNMIREIKVKNNTYLVILENYVLGAINEE